MECVYCFIGLLSVNMFQDRTQHLDTMVELNAIGRFSMQENYKVKVCYFDSNEAAEKKVGGHDMLVLRSVPNVFSLEAVVIKDKTERSVRHELYRGCRVSFEGVETPGANRVIIRLRSLRIVFDENGDAELENQLIRILIYLEAGRLRSRRLQ